MNLISLYELVAQFPEQQRIAFVGNAPSLRNSRLADWIEGHDIVVRFNESILAGFESDVGTRTDILVSNPYTEQRAQAPLGGAPVKMILIIAPQTRRGDRDVFERWVGDIPVAFTYTPDIKTDDFDRRKISLTTGTYGLSLLSNVLRPSHVSISGFTMFLAGASGQYWQNAEPSGLRAHSPVHEAAIFINLVNTLSARVEVTSDVHWVATTVGAALRSDIRVRPLPEWIPPA